MWMQIYRGAKKHPHRKAKNSRQKKQKHTNAYTHTVCSHMVNQLPHHNCGKAQVHAKHRYTKHQLLHTHTEDSHPRRGVRVQCSLRLHPQFVSINHTVARHGLVRRSTSLCNLLLMCCTLSLSEPIWSDCEQTEIPPMLSEQVLLMGLSIRPSPITACLQSPLNTLHRYSPDFCG